MNPPPLYKFSKEDWDALEEQFKKLHVNSFSFVLDNNGSLQEARSTYADAFVYYVQLLELRGMDLSSKAEGIIYSFARKLWIQKLQKRRVNLDFVKHRREFFEMEDAFHQMDSIQKRTIRTGESLASAGEPCRTLLLECLGRKKPIEEVASRLRFADEERALQSLSKCVLNMIKKLDGKEIALAEPQLRRIMRLTLEGMEEPQQDWSEDEAVCLTLMTRLSVMIRNYVVRNERIQHLKSLQERCLDQCEASEDVFESKQESKESRNSMKPITIISLAVLAAVGASVITAFGLTESMRKPHVEVVTQSTVAVASPIASVEKGKVQKANESNTEAASLAEQGESADVKIKASAATAAIGHSAFALSEQGYFLCAIEGIEEMSTLGLRFEPIGPPHPAQVLAVDPETGLALLKTEYSPTLPKYFPYRFKQNELAAGENIYSVGFPRQLSVYTNGSVSSSSTQHKVQAILQAASPGAPVFDAFGQVAGLVVTQSSENGSEATLIDSEFIQRWLKDVMAEKNWAIDINQRNRLFHSDRVAQVERIKPYVVGVEFVAL